MDVEVGRQGQIAVTVADADTAIALGSGDLPVLATPRVIAWMEQATCRACPADEQSTTVGVRVDVAHTRASAVGTSVRATARVTGVDGPTITFKVWAEQDGPAGRQEIARGVVQRAVVDRHRFLDRLG